MKTNKVWWVLASVVGLACGPMAVSGCSDDGVSETADARKMGVSSLRASSGPNALLRDEPATAAFERVRTAFANGAAFEGKLGIYQLAPVGDAASDLRRRAAELGIRGEVVDKLNHAAISDGVNDLRIINRSGAERFLVTDLFHKGPDAQETKSDDEYVALAGRRAQTIGSDLPLADMYPYKVRRFKNAVAEEDGEPRVTTYQVAVAFNQSIDDLPFIGSGGKVIIHMTVDGQPVGHEILVRKIQSTVQELRGDDLSDPADAQAEAESRLVRRGIDPQQYRLVRSEFGYYRLGRDNTQHVVAPHYGFFYGPTDGTSKNLIEVVPALKDASLRAMAERDVQENQDRLAKRLETPDSSR